MIIQQYKIVFAGSMGAGKTEAIKSLSEIPILEQKHSTLMYKATRKPRPL